MKRLAIMALLWFPIALYATAAGAFEPQAPAKEPKGAISIPRVEEGDIPAAKGDANKPRTVSPEGAAYLQRLMKNTPFGTNAFDFKGLRAGMGSRIEPTIKDVKLIRVKVGETPCEWVLAPGADPDLRLLYLHGGGFVSGSGGHYLPLAAQISAAAKCAVLLVDYRLAPEHRFPAGLDDCVAAHVWMVDNGPAGPAAARATFVAGDSAGGNLTLATLLALRDSRLRLPAGGIPISPTTDLTLASESLKSVHDPIISSKTMPIFREHYLGDGDPKNPLASPVFGDYRGLPPLLIQAGEHEMLRDDSVRVAKKARADGLAVKLEIWPGMFHVFQSHNPLLPEGQEAIDHIAEFIAMHSAPAAKSADVNWLPKVQKMPADPPREKIGRLPRPFLVLGGEQGPGAADGDRSWPLLEAALPVWRLYGEPTRLGLLNHGRGHSLKPEEFEMAAEWLGAYLK